MLLFFSGFIDLFVLVSFLLLLFFFFLLREEMEINRLHSDELSYELLVRGAVTEGSVDEKRQRLRTFMKLERLGNLPLSVSTTLEPESEIKICSDKILELDEALNNFNPDNATNEQAKIQTRALHVMGRLNHIFDRSYSDKKTKLITHCAEIMERLDVLIRTQRCAGNDVEQDVSGDLVNLMIDDSGEAHGSQNEQTSAPKPRISILDTPNENIQEPLLQTNYHVLSRLTFPSAKPLISEPALRETSDQTHSVHCAPEGRRPAEQSQASRHSVSGTQAPLGLDARVSPVRHCNDRLHSTLAPDCHLPQSALEETTHRAQLSASKDPSDDFSRIFSKITKWNLQFSGQGSVTGFIERAEELCYACGFTHAQLFQCAVLLFSDTALSWFRAVRNDLHSWDDLKTKLRATYLSSEYEEDIWCDIRNRTQGQDEKTVIFCAQMRNLFKKLSRPPSEERQLCIIRRNLLPTIQAALALHSINSFSELEAAAREIEGVQLRTQRMRPPPTNPNMVAEPELMYRRARNISAQVSTAKPASTAATQVGGNSNSNRDDVVCWNCKETGHFKGNCTKPLRRHCFRCGKEGETTKTCPHCNRTGNERSNH